MKDMETMQLIQLHSFHMVKRMQLIQLHALVLGVPVPRGTRRPPQNFDNKLLDWLWLWLWLWL